MTNGEKYKTAKERTEAFEKYCHGKKECENYRKKCHKVLCVLEWLGNEAEGMESMPCPYCRGETFTYTYNSVGRKTMYKVCCEYCSYNSKAYHNKAEAIAAHNRVCKAVAANSTTINVGDTIAYRSCDDDQPEWKSFKVRFIEHGYLYENEDCSGDNIAIECAHKVVVRY